MQQVKGRCAPARWFTAFILFTLFAASLVFGQTAQVMRFNVSYGFTVGSKALPAGTYTFAVSRDLSTLTVQSDTAGSVVANIVTRISGPNEMFRGGYLIFDKANGRLILSEVWLSGMGGMLLHSIPKGDERVGMSGSSLDPTRSYSGKAAYDLTCARCHGENGDGNPDADKFFGLKIPRLTSAEVQGKSDAQLKLIIAQGTSVMPPVEVDESGFRHRLPPQDVDAVIAYLRSLKQ